MTVRAIPGRGNGVVATRDIARGETLWAEAPLVGAQSPENEATCLACARCHRSVGDIDAQLTLMSGGRDAETVRRACVAIDGADPPSRDGEGWCDVASAARRDATLARAMKTCEGIAPATPCVNAASRGCTTLYCGEMCRAKHAKEDGHALVCAGAGGTDGADAAATTAAALKRHCGHHDSLFLATAVIARVASSLADGNDWDAATLPFRAFAQGPWWEVASDGDPMMLLRLRGIAARALALTRDCLLYTSPSPRD